MGVKVSVAEFMVAPLGTVTLLNLTAASTSPETESPNLTELMSQGFAVPNLEPSSFVLATRLWKSVPMLVVVLEVLVLELVELVVLVEVEVEVDELVDELVLVELEVVIVFPNRTNPLIFSIPPIR